MNFELKQALRPVKMKIRRNRFLRGTVTGLAAGLGTAVLLQAVSFFVPVPDRGLWAAAAGAAVLLLTAIGNALRPVKNNTAAEAADACGLKERVITALEEGQRTSGSEGDIVLLQRKDACAALEGLDVKQIRPGNVKKQLLAALGCAVLLGGLLLIPSPRDPEAAARKALTRTLQEGREAITRAAETDEENLTEEKKNELRKITDDLKRDLEKSRDAADAMVALDRAEQRLENFRKQTAGDAAAAAEGMNGNGENQTAENGEKTGNSSENASGQAGEGQQGAASGSTGMTAGQMQTMQALSSLKSAVNPSAGQETDMKGNTGLQGTGAGQGQKGQNGSGMNGANGGSSGDQTGTGAGEGSTNEEQKGSSQNSGSHTIGSRDPKYKEEQYETIYDPERTERTRKDVMTEQDRLGDDGSVQLETGPGKGNTGGNVPWNEALNDYAETEARAADRENLTVQERQWVNNYFTLLTEQKPNE